LVLDVADAGDQASHFVFTQHHGQLVRNPYRLHLGHRFWATQGDFEQEVQAHDGGVERDGGGALVNQVQLETTQVFIGGGVRGSAQKLCKLTHRTDVGRLGLGFELAHPHVLGHALAQWRDGLNR